MSKQVIGGGLENDRSPLRSSSIPRRCSPALRRCWRSLSSFSEGGRSEARRRPLVRQSLTDPQCMPFMLAVEKHSSANVGNLPNCCEFSIFLSTFGPFSSVSPPGFACKCSIRQNVFKFSDFRFEIAGDVQRLHEIYKLTSPVQAGHKHAAVEC